NFRDLSYAANMRTAIVSLGLLFSLAFVLMCEQNRALRHHSHKIAFTQRRLRKQRQELSINEQRYRSLFSQHPDPVFSLDCEGKFTHVNDAFCEQVEVDREQLLDMHFKEFLDDNEFARVFPIFTRIIQTGQSERYEANVITYRTKSVKIFDITNLPIIVGGEVLDRKCVV